MPVAAVRIAAVLFGGATAGLAGAILTLSQSHVFTEGMTAGRGFIALAVVIFGRWRPAGVLAAALFFGLASALQFRLQARGLGIPYPLFLMFPYVVTLAVLAFVAGGGRSPGDLGRPYAREARAGGVTCLARRGGAMESARPTNVEALKDFAKLVFGALQGPSPRG